MIMAIYGAPLPGRRKNRAYQTLDLIYTISLLVVITLTTDVALIYLQP